MSVAEPRTADGAAPIVGRTLSRRCQLARRWLTIGYVAAATACVVFIGVPQGRESLLLWILAGIGIRSIGQTWRSFGRAVADWIPFTGVLIAYDYTRGIADHLGFTVHVAAPAHADEWLFGGTLPTYWLQQHFYIPADPRWYDGIATIIYTSHFLVTPIVAAILWLRNRRMWLAFITRIMALSVVGLTVYVVYPSAPPWYAARAGLIEPVTRLSTRGFMVLGIPHAARLISGGQAAVNNVAAMPSLHTATATVVALFFLPRVSRWARIPLACYPLAMGLVLVYTGEHYVVDLLFGYLTGIVITVALVAAERIVTRYRLARLLADSGNASATALVEPD